MKPKKTHKNGAAPKKRMPKWKRHIDEYPPSQAARLRFATDDDIDEAIGIVWGGRLTGMPFDLGGDGMSLIVPRVSVRYFTEAGLQFTERAVAT